MAKVPVETISIGKAVSVRRRCFDLPRTHFKSMPFISGIRSSQSMEDKNKAFKEMGLFALKKKIEDAVLRAEMMTPTALELEEERRIEKEEMIRKYNLWEDLSKSDEILLSWGNTAKVVNGLKDLQYKVEEAKLITQLADMDTINYPLFKQAYKASVDVSKFLDQYEISKLLNGPYDQEGACVIIRAGSNGLCPDLWAEKLLSMYMRWGEKQGHIGRIIEIVPSEDGGIMSATVEFESDYAYGCLYGEKGTHTMISFLDGIESCLASVDVVPLFLEACPDVHINKDDIIVSSPEPCGQEQGYNTTPAVCIQHIPTGIHVRCSGERSHYSNQIKAENRLKARLLVTAMEQGVTEIKSIKKNAIPDIWKQETRRYIYHPYKLVSDVKTGIQISDLDTVLDGNILPLLGAHISFRHGTDMD